MPAAKKRDQLTLGNELIDEGTAAEGDALSVDCRTHQEVVLIEAHEARGPWLGYADRREPLRPIEPGIPATIVVELEQHVPREILRLVQRTRRIGCERRTAHGLQALAEKALRVARRHRLRAIANREVDALPIEVEDPVVGRDEHIDVRVPLPEPRQARQKPQRGKWNSGRDRERLHRLLASYARDREGKLVENGPRRDLKDLARLGQSKRAVPALEKRRSELLLERLHLARQRRLRQEQLLAGAREAQMTRRRVETLKEVQRGEAPSRKICFWHSQ